MDSSIETQSSILVRDFIECHNRLTQYMKKKLKKDGEHKSLINEIARLNRDRFIANNRQYLMDLCDLRNTIAHSPLQGKDEEYIAVPCEDTVKKYKQFVALILAPPKALDHAVKTNDVFYSNWGSKIVDIIMEMKKRGYSFVPVMGEESIVQGVFSESSLFSFFGVRGELVLDKSDRIQDIKDAVLLEGHDSEYFEFVARSIDLYSLVDLFRDDEKNGKRLGMVFITDKGSHTDKLLGIFTAWDALRLSKTLMQMVSLA